MPTYEYLCTACGHDLEAVQSFSDDPLTTCPECGGALRKVFGSVGIVLKGSGFYKTDNRRSGKSADSGSPSESGKTSGSNGSGTNGASTEKSESPGKSESKSGSSGSSSDAPGKAASSASTGASKGSGPS